MAQLDQQPSSFLIGHAAPVLSLDNRDWMLASGSEDKTCRIWDIRTNKVHKALTGFKSSVMTTSFTPVDQHTIYVGSGNTVFTYDLRMESPILDTTQSTRMYEGAEDEINQIHVNHKASYLATCDDAGDVRILDLKQHKWMKKLQRQHENIVMTVQFIPKKELQAISGGMDKLVVAWDFYKGRAIQHIETDTAQSENANAKQLFNPPFVHSITVHPTGTRAAIGLGDGTIQFLHNSVDLPLAPSVADENEALTTVTSAKKNKKKSGGSSNKNGGDGWIIGGRLVEAHSSPITCIEYAGFKPEWLISSASNGSIAIWDDKVCRYKTTQQDVLKQQSQEEIPFGRAVEPVHEFKTKSTFERLNCISSSKSIDGEGIKRLFVGGTHYKVVEKKLQGRIGVYHL